MIRYSGIVALWLAGCVSVFAGVNINEPYLMSAHGLRLVVLFSASIAVLILLIKRGYWSRRGIAGRLLIVLWCLLKWTPEIGPNVKV